jgi:hypothetical protein
MADSKKVFLLQSLMSWLDGRNTRTAATNWSSIQSINGRLRVPSPGSSSDSCGLISRLHPRSLFLLIYSLTTLFAAALPLTLVNYLINGWLQDSIDHFYMASWKIFVGMLAVFNVLVRPSPLHCGITQKLTKVSLLSPSPQSDTVSDKRNSSPPSGNPLNGCPSLSSSSGACHSIYPRPFSAISSESTWSGHRQQKNSKQPASSLAWTKL